LDKKQATAAEALCPLPRSGVGDARLGAAFHYICLFLATALVGVGIGAMRTASPEEVGFAEVFCGVCLALLGLYLWRVTRTARGNLFLLILVGAFLAYSTHSLIPTGVLCGVIFAVAEGSVAIALLPRGKGVLIPLLPLLAYALTAALTLDLVGSAAVLIPYPPMLVLGLGTRRATAREDGPTRAGVIAGTSLALGVTMGGMLLLSFSRHLGTADVSVLLESAREGLIEFLMSAELPTDLPPENLEALKKLYAYGNVKLLVDSTFNLLPALYTVALMAMVFICQSIQFATLRAFGHGQSLTARVRELRLSLVACVVFLAAYLVVFLDNSVVISMASVVAQNVYVILLPGLAVSGVVRAWKAMTGKGVRALGCLFYLVILIPCVMAVYPIIPAAVEVISRLYSAIVEKLKPADGEDDPFGENR
jgi:hypothetical protein